MPANDLVEVLVKRLDLMHEVALWKWIHKKNVWQPAQEQSTLNKHLSWAKELGLDLIWVEAILQAQMDAAKVLQWLLIDAWRVHPPSTQACTDLETEIRPKLNAITTELIKALMECAPVCHTPEFKKAILQHLQQFRLQRKEPYLAWKRAFEPLL